MEKDKELQVENGYYTRIVNPLIENLVKIPFKGCELAVALFIIRKTYGYQKKEDKISLSQFQQGLERSRQTIITALKNLQLVNVARLVKRGNSKLSSNIWAINKYSDTWKLVNMARLVQRKRSTSLTEAPQLVYTARHTKEKQKKNTKESSRLPPADINSFIELFKSINPSYERLFGNKTERACAERLLTKYTLEKMKEMFIDLPDILGQPYAPRITTPYEFEKNLGKLLQFIEQNKKIIKNKQPNVIFS